MTANRYRNGPRTVKGPHRDRLPGWFYAVWLGGSAVLFAFLFIITR